LDYACGEGCYDLECELDGWHGNEVAVKPKAGIRELEKEVGVVQFCSSQKVRTRSVCRPVLTSIAGKCFHS